MEARKFNNIMPRVNEIWAADVLGMELNTTGPDLINNDCIMEIKFNINHKNYPQTWTVMDYQTKYPEKYPERHSYWGLGNYTLSISVQEIKTKNREKLEALVSQRELWIVDWDWMNQFPPSETSGRTQLSEWNNTLRYPKRHLLPKIIKTYEVCKGLIHLTENVDISHLIFLETGVKEEFIPI